MASMALKNIRRPYKPEAYFEKHVIGRPIANITNYFKGVITEEMKDPETSTRNRAVLVKEII